MKPQNLLQMFVLLTMIFSLRADVINIGTAGSFGVLGEAGVTNTGPSNIYGSVAGSTGTPAVTGFPPGTVIAPGVLYLAGVANSGVGTPFGDALAAYNYAGGLASINEGTASLGAGGLTSLTPGVYSFTSPTVLLSGLFQLDAGGSNTASWTFQIPFALTTSSASVVDIINTGNPGLFNGNITWVVGSSATLGTTSTFLGSIISQAGDVLNHAATVGCGRVISLNASVTLDQNTVSTPSDCTVQGGAAATPEPGTVALLLCGLLAMVFVSKIYRLQNVKAALAPEGL
jgi:hypothetical protein